MDILDLLRQMNQNKPSQLNTTIPTVPDQSQILPSGTDHGIMDFTNQGAPQVLPSGTNHGIMDYTHQSTTPMASDDSDDSKDDDTDATKKIATTKKTSSRAPASTPAATPKTDGSDDSDDKDESDYDHSDALKEAQGKADRNHLNANLLDAGQTINEALSRTKFNRDVNKTLQSTADDPVKDVQMQQTVQKNDLDNLAKMYKTSSDSKLRDPDSDISKGTRTLLKQMGINTGETTSAFDVQQSTAIDKLLGIKATGDLRAQMASERSQDRADRMDEKRTDEQNKRDQYIWNRGLQQARGDKDISTAVTAANRLQNTLNNLQEKSVVSPQDLRELQQLTVAVQGLNGRSGVHEREDRYANSLGLKSTDMEQFLTGQMTDVGKQNDILAKMKELARLEVGNFNGNLANRFAYKTAGMGDILKRHPEYSADLDQLKNAAMGQVVGSKEDSSAGASGGRAPAAATPSLASNEVRRQLPDGKVGIFNVLTKEFVRYE